MHPWQQLISAAAALSREQLRDRYRIEVRRGARHALALTDADEPREALARIVPRLPDLAVSAWWLQVFPDLNDPEADVAAIRFGHATATSALWLGDQALAAIADDRDDPVPDPIDVARARLGDADADFAHEQILEAVRHCALRLGRALNDTAPDAVARSIAIACGELLALALLMHARLPPELPDALPT